MKTENCYICKQKSSKFLKLSDGTIYHFCVKCNESIERKINDIVLYDKICEELLNDSISKLDEIR